MKKFFNKKAILSTAVAVMMAATAATSLCANTVCATSLTDWTYNIVQNIQSGNYTIRAQDGTCYTVNKYRGSVKPVNFIGEDGQHYYIDNKCMAVVNGTYGTITVFDTSIWDGGRQLTEIGGVPLKEIICFTLNDGEKSYVSDIRTCYENGWIYDYTMHLHGKAAGNLWYCNYVMEFTDEEGDTYSLSMFSSSYKEHTIDYNSSAYKFKKIEWCVKG